MNAKYENDKWERLATDLDSKRHGHSAVWLEDELFVIGGQQTKLVFYVTDCAVSSPYFNLGWTRTDPWIAGKQDPKWTVRRLKMEVLRWVTSCTSDHLLCDFRTVHFSCSFHFDIWWLWSVDFESTGWWGSKWTVRTIGSEREISKWSVQIERICV